MEDLNILIAANNRNLDDDSYSNLINSLTNGITSSAENKFDRSAFEELRMANKQGMA